MSLILPGLIVFLLIYAYIKKADVYSAFISGALEALPMLYKTLPSMCAMMAALSLLRKSGAMEAFTGAVSPALQKAGMPGELVPLFLLRPFSGSAALALLRDIFDTCGADSFVGVAASVMLGSTETIFYTMSVYLGSIGVEPNPGKRTLRKKASSRSIEATGGFLYGKALLERNTTKGNGNEGSRVYAQANWRGVGI